MVADALTDARAPWWVIAGAAAHLHGLDYPVRDVDVLLGADDARRLLPPLGLVPVPGVPDERFVSELFARWTAPPLPVEFMAGLAVRDGDGWAPVRPATRERVVVDGRTVCVPSRAELAAMLRRFGRAKDIGRADRLDRLSESAPPVPFVPSGLEKWASR